MNFIAIETSTNICSVALFVDSKLVDILEKETNDHSKCLPVFVNDFLKNKNNFLDYIALSTGPGSFTGLKVGSAFSKGLATALQLPIIPINTFDGIRYNIEDINNYCIAIYSHKDYAFVGFYNNTSTKSKYKCMVINKIFEQTIYGYGFPKDLNIEYKAIKPNAASIGFLSLEKFDSFKNKSIDNINPIYLMVE